MGLRMRTSQISKNLLHIPDTWTNRGPLNDDIIRSARTSSMGPQERPPWAQVRGQIVGLRMRASQALAHGQRGTITPCM
ncbi:hypothetical protein AMTR_s00093p00156170 [Amborella trichopoda]|uniref:Uncharacterized protein n=1 Tax=Amborella trichopoda TaxID=13333 RepID=W1NVX6_AMBTC|nr:hypothetical protein AMTR_s00093p00156170 [Amborella trichopoda]